MRAERQLYRIDTAPPRWFKESAVAKAEAIAAADATKREIRMARVLLASDRDGLIAILNGGEPQILRQWILHIAKPKGTP